jgi:hypothetical protein
MSAKQEKRLRKAAEKAVRLHVAPEAAKQAVEHAARIDRVKMLLRVFILSTVISLSVAIFYASQVNKCAGAR